MRNYITSARVFFVAAAVILLGATAFAMPRVGHAQEIIACGDNTCLYTTSSVCCSQPVDGGGTHYQYYH